MATVESSGARVEVPAGRATLGARPAEIPFGWDNELAIRLGTPLKTLADVIHPFPAFNRVLGAVSRSSRR